jgi:putative toxin-antitoxin system antitoxin component (TIGR02293 family)
MTQLSIGSRNPAKLITLFKQGLGTDLFSKVAEAIDISEGQLADRTGIPVSTLTRRKRSGRLSQHESERLYRVIHIYNRAVEVLGSDMAARNWIKNPAKALGWSTPLAYLDTEIGAREVEAILGRIEHGVFS